MILKEWDQAKICHQIDGRIRFRLDPKKVDAFTLHRFKTELLAVQGVEQVETNPKTGSLVVYYDSNKKISFLEKLIEHSASLEKNAMPYSKKIWRFIQKGGQGIDSLLLGASRGKLDLSLVIALLLLFAAMKQMRVNKLLPAGLTLSILALNFLRSNEVHSF
ncbi:MAG: HMA2 domain-containing protein [Oligoflexales bacterium]